MSGQAAHESSASSDGLGTTLALIGMFGFILLGGIWMLSSHYILFITLKASYYLFRAYDWVNGFVPFMLAGEAAEIRGAIRAIPGMNPYKETFGTFVTLAHLHGYLLRWVFLVLAAWTAWKVPKGIVRFNYRRNIRNVYDLIDIQSKHFAASALVKGAYILRDHPYIGPYATYALPLDFALDHQLLWASKIRVDPLHVVDKENMRALPAFEAKDKINSFVWKRNRLPHHDYVLLDLEGAHDVFAAQLGPAWSGWESMPEFLQAFYAICCLQISGKQKEATRLINQVAMSWDVGKYDKDTGKRSTPSTADFTGVKDILAKEASNPLVLEAAAKHHHTFCVLVETLRLARTRGRLMSANFLWLKWAGYRVLWYAICGEGGQSFYWEAAGIAAHMQFESVYAKRALVQPHVVGAVMALEDQMRKEHWIEPGLYGEAAKQAQVDEANKKLNAAAEEQEREAKKSNAPRKSGSTQNSVFAGQMTADRKAQRTKEEEP